ncbi:MAG: carbon-nitrogen hydrolase family protein [Gammaproteobacteria bacterium]|nr:carbon-nitrogen hydrolase family protein [Gammaproteobacteria bacterium]
MSMTHPRYKVAAVQAAPAFLDLDAGVDKAIGYIEQAAAAGARLIAFPETWIPGYPWWIWLGAPAWAAQRGFVQRYFDNSLPYGSPQAARIARAAQAGRITVVLGLSEREAGSLYIAQWLIGPDGQTIAHRRKLRPTHSERTVFGEGDGSDLAVHATDLGRLGALNCWENLLSLTKYAMYSQNEQVHVASWPSFSTYDFAHALSWDVSSSASKVYAVEGGCFVVLSSAIVSQEMIELLCDTPEKRDLIRAGGGRSTIFGPDGRAVSKPLPEDQEGLVYADIDLAEIAVAKNVMDPVGHYSRPDVMRLLFNRRRMRRVETLAQPLDAPSDPGD